MEQFLIENPWVIWLALAWIIPWKGIALWHAAKLNHKWWFIALLIVNTLAVLEILYIFIFSKVKEKQKN
ncbi:hypothetical protein KKG58_04320 [Patescibacteria group bacterium]|nr:hypothetical protein [Patescibacteria group bacterium]